jgi:uncharacterized protein YbaP (TraB family)
MRLGTGASTGRITARALAVWLALIGLTACGDAPDQSQDSAAPASPLVYEIASADGTVEGWMVGTIHALPAGIEWRTPAIVKAVDGADLLVVEVADLGGGTTAASLNESLARSPGQPPLAARVPPALRSETEALSGRAGLDADEATDLETWAAAIALARVDATGDPENGVDRALIADFAERRVRELEGLRGQLAIFDHLPEARQRSMLAAVVRESDKARKDPERLQRAWLAGDAATIEQSTHEGFLADPDLRVVLLTARNQRWAAALLPVLAQAPRPLIAVGTAHLVGPEGLAELLAAQGYRVRRIS